MHKGLDLLRKNYNQQEGETNESSKQKKNIIFLDIDGVIQPSYNQMRHDHDLDAMLEYLCTKYDPNVVRHGDKYDVAAAYYDWNEIAVGRIAYLCHNADAYIVMSTGWRQYNNTERFRLFLSFYGLDDYLLDTCENIPYEEMSQIRKEKGYFVDEKAAAIRRWIEAHKEEINRYIVIDDMDMTYEFGTSFIHTGKLISDDDLRLGYYMLNKSNEPDFKNNQIRLNEPRIRYEEKIMGGRKIIFFRVHYRRKSKYDITNHKVREYRHLISLLLHRFGGEHLNAEDRAALFIWVRHKLDSEDIESRYMQNCYFARTRDSFFDKGKIMYIYRGINEKDRRVWEENSDEIKKTAEEMLELLI